MKILQITLQHQRDNRWPVSATYDSSDGLPFRQEGELGLGENWDKELLALTLDPEQYGEYLGKALFREGILIISKRAESSIQPQPTDGDDANEPDVVHLFLNIEAPELQPLRWERLAFLDDDGTWVSLAQHQRMVFSYYFPSLVSRQYPALNKHGLKALLFVASPLEESNGYKPFDVPAAVDRLEKGFGNIPVKVMSAPQEVTWEALRDELNQRHYPILHIVAHGYYKEGQEATGNNAKEDPESYLILLDEQQKPQVVSATTLIDQLKRMNGQLPSLIFLSSCETATPEASQGAHGHLARRLLDSLGTPATIAMSDKVQIETAYLLGESFYTYLHRDAHVDIALATAGMALSNRRDRHLPVLYHRLGSRPLFTQEDKLLEQLNAQEIKHGLALLGGNADAGGLLDERAPILRDKYQQQVNKLDVQHPDIKVLKKLDDLCMAATDIGFAALAQGEPVGSYNATCPFPGMHPFKESDNGDGTDYQQFFFGRNAKVTELLERLKQLDVLVIKGVSGSGKSSIVYAGILPKLKERYQARGGYLQVKTLRLRCICNEAHSTTSPYEQLLTTIQALDTGQDAIIFIDELEKLFATCTVIEGDHDEQIYQQFLDTLLRLPQQYPRWKIIIGIQAEFVEAASVDENLKKILQNPAHVAVLNPMTHEEERGAIEDQVIRVGMILEQGLVHQILVDLDGKLGRMARVQHVLKRLWEYRRGRHLQLSAYKQFTHEIIANAERHYRQYSDNPLARSYLRNIYLRLVDFRGNGVRHIRERVHISEFYPSLIHKTPRRKELIDQLIKEITDIKQHIVFPQKSEMELTYDKLISEWSRLQGWLETSSLNQYRQEIAEASRKWISEHEDDWFLQHRGATLEKINEYKKDGLLLTSEDEDRYLEACGKKQKRHSKFRRIFGWLFPAVLFIAAAILSITSLMLCTPHKESTLLPSETHPVSKDSSQ